MNLLPTNDRVIIKPDEPEKKLGNIYLPDQAQKRTVTGVVVAVGPGKTLDDGTRRPINLQVGDRVMFRSYPVDPIEDAEGGKLAMSEDNVIARILSEPVPDHVVTDIRFVSDAVRTMSTWEADAAAVPPLAKPEVEPGLAQKVANTPTVNAPLSGASNLEASLSNYATLMSQKQQQHQESQPKG
jgi:chaperonin GroES